jgi:integrase
MLQWVLMKAGGISKKQKNGITLMKRGGRYILQKSFSGVGQKQIRLGTKEKNAFTKAARFLLTAETDGYQKAVDELAGKKILKKGDDPTIEQIESLYIDFCNQSAKPPRSNTIKHNVARLKCIMNRAGVKTVGKIDKNTLFKDWFEGDTATPSEKRTFASAIKAAQSIFKKSALDYYASRNVNLYNPFEGIELIAPKVSQFVPPPNEVLETIYGSVENELKPHDAMIVLLAFCGLRRSEIEAIVPSNFSKQADNVLLSIEETGSFQPKAGQSGFVPISLEMYERLLRLRGDSKSPFFVPGKSEKQGSGRLWERIRIVNKWLQGKGLKNKPLHTCRKITGSIVAKSQGILEAAKVLRNTPQVCMVNYLGVASVKTVDVEGSLKPKDIFQEMAEKLGITEEELRKKLVA